MSGPIRFTPADDFSASRPGPAWWFVFERDSLLVTRPEPDTVGVPIRQDLDIASEIPGLDPKRRQYLGLLYGRPCYAAEVPKDSTTPKGMSFEKLRNLFGNLEETAYAVAGLGLQLINWDKTHRFCGQCGGPTQDKADERAKICADCGLINHPRISPAVIVAVVRDGRLLLAHAGRYPIRKLYSVIAGYVEPGENLEETVRRELMEEVAIEVRDIRYFGSQPWPYSGSLMVGFTAEYAGGEIREDGVEILHADWYAPGDLPDIPGWGSIARQLIDWFVSAYKIESKPGMP